METLPLKSGEIYDMQYLSGLLSMLYDGQKTLRNRIKVAGIEEAYTSFIKDGETIFKALLRTIPQEKLRVLKRNLNAMSLTISINRTAVAKEEETVVPIDDLREVCKKACTDCSLCEGGSQQMAGCAFRKHLKQLLMVDFDESDGICMAAKIDW